MRAPAFTLVELLVVITIIALLAGVIVLNFTGARERQQLALLADKTLAMLQQAQTEVRGGKFVSDHYLCEGAHLVTGEEPVFVTLPYADTGCDFDAIEEEEYGLATGSAVLGEMSVGTSTFEDLYALFVPPSGELQLMNEGGVFPGDGRVDFESNGSPYNVSLSLVPETGLVSLFVNDEE